MALADVNKLGSVGSKNFIYSTTTTRTNLEETGTGVVVVTDDLAVAYLP